MDYNYDRLRELDAVTVANSSLAARLIRLWTAKLKGYNGLAEMVRMRIGNHTQLIVKESGKLWAAEMLKGGFERNSLRTNLKDIGRQRIVGVRRLPVFDDPKKRERANGFIIDHLFETVEYDYKGIGSFVGITMQNPKEWYCSEIAEIIANKHNATWDNWQLQRGGVNGRIAPVEIQYGYGSVEVTGYLK